MCVKALDSAGARRVFEDHLPLPLDAINGRDFFGILLKTRTTLSAKEWVTNQISFPTRFPHDNFSSTNSPELRFI